MVAFFFCGRFSHLYLHSHPIPLPLVKEGAFNFRSKDRLYYERVSISFEFVRAPRRAQRRGVKRSSHRERSSQSSTPIYIYIPTSFPSLWQRKGPIMNRLPSPEILLQNSRNRAQEMPKFLLQNSCKLDQETPETELDSRLNPAHLLPKSLSNFA